MRAGLDDVPLVHDDDRIRILDGGEAVRDDQARAAFHQAVHGLLDVFFSARIDVRGRLVEDEDVRVREERTADGDELPLALRDVVAGVGEQGLVSFGQGGRDLVDVAEGGGAFEVLLRGVRLGVAHVAADRVREEDRILQNDAHEIAQVVEGNVADVHAVEGDPAAVDVIESHQQVDDGRLAAPRGADEGDFFTCLDFEVEVVDDLLAGHVGEVHVLEFDDAFCGVHVHLAALVLGGGVHDLEDALGAGHRRLDLSVQLRQFVDRAGELLGVDDEGGDDADGDVALDDLPAAEDGDHDEGDVVEHIHDRPHRAREDLGEDAGAGEFIGRPVEVIDHAVLLVVGGDGLVVGDLLVDDAVEGAEQALAFHVQLADVSGKESREQHREDDHRARQQCQLPAVRKHDRNGPDQRQQSREQRGQGRADDVGDVLRVVGHAADQVAVGMRVEVADRQIDRLAE